MELETDFRAGISSLSSVARAAGVGDPFSGISLGPDFPAGERVRKPEIVESSPRDWLAEGDVS